MAALTCNPRKMKKSTSKEMKKSTSKDLLFSERFPESRIPKTCVLNKTDKPNGIPGRNFVVPQSRVMERLKDFLPQMEAANEELLRKFAQDPESVSLEVPEDSDEPRIEMECFLMEMQSSDSSDSDSDSDSDSEEEEEAGATPVTEANLKLPGCSQKRARPLIMEMEGPPSKVAATGRRYVTRSVARSQKQ